MKKKGGYLPPFLFLELSLLHCNFLNFLCTEVIGYCDNINSLLIRSCNLGSIIGSCEPYSTYRVNFGRFHLFRNYNLTAPQYNIHI